LINTLLDNQARQRP